MQKEQLLEYPDDFNVLSISIIAHCYLSIYPLSLPFLLRIFF